MFPLASATGEGGRSWEAPANVTGWWGGCSLWVKEANIWP